MSGEAPRVLVVGFGLPAAARVVADLLADGYRASVAGTAGHARALARIAEPDLVLLASRAERPEATELLREIRAAAPGSDWRAAVPVIVLGERCAESDVVRAFEAGADDFVHIRRSYLVLRVHIRAVLARSRSTTDDVLGVGSLLLDRRSRTVTLGARPVCLTRLEFDLLHLLASEPARVFSRSEILVAVWDWPSPCATRTVDTHASRVRHKLDAASPEGWIVAVRGVGYRLN